VPGSLTALATFNPSLDANEKPGFCPGFLSFEIDLQAGKPDGDAR
jgi:hypothetical protein